MIRTCRLRADGSRNAAAALAKHLFSRAQKGRTTREARELRMMDSILRALNMASAHGMGDPWPLILGFALSAVVQAVVSHRQMSRLLPERPAGFRCDRSRPSAQHRRRAPMRPSRLRARCFRKGADFTARWPSRWPQLISVLVTRHHHAGVPRMADYVGGVSSALRSWSSLLVGLFRIFSPPRSSRIRPRSKADKGGGNPLLEKCEKLSKSKCFPELAPIADMRVGESDPRTLRGRCSQHNVTVTSSDRSVG